MGGCIRFDHTISSNGVNKDNNEIRLRTANQSNISNLNTNTNIVNVNLEVNHFTESNEHDSKFNDFEEWDGDRYMGEGIKRMKGYKCKLPLDELNKLREQFWSANIKKSATWKILQQASYIETSRAQGVLTLNNIIPLNGCLNRCKDLEGNIYKIPNFCINNPYIEKELSKEIPNKETKELKVILVDVYENIRHKLIIEDNLTGKDLKNQICSHFNIGDDYKLRVISGGTEIKDDCFIYQYNIKDEATIQIIKNKIIPDN